MFDKQLLSGIDNSVYFSMNLKKIGLLITFLGILINFGNLYGIFAHPDRVRVVSLLRSKGQIPSNDSGFDTLLKAFPPPATIDPSLITGFGPVSLIASGGYNTITSPLSYFVKDRGPSEAIVNFDAFQNWASTTSYPWFSLSVSVVGFLITLL